MKKDFLVKTGRKILPKSRFRSYIGKKFQKQVIDENNNRVWGTDTNTPLQSLEAMKFTLTLLEILCNVLYPLSILVEMC